jgi:hypothetical protein
MRVYFAGTGHDLTKNKKFLKKIRAFLISYFYIAEQVDPDLIRRVDYIKKMKSKK